MINEEHLKNITENPPNLERRDYPTNSDSIIAAMTDMPWYPPYAQDTPHYHNCMEIGICLAGRGIVGIADRQWNFSPGSIVIIPAGVYHFQQNMGEGITHWRYLVFEEARLLNEGPRLISDAIRKHLLRYAKVGLFLDNCDAAEEIGRLSSYMYDLQRRYSKSALPELEACLISMMARLARQEEYTIPVIPSQPAVARVIDPALLYISEKYTDKIAMQDLARSCAMSESYFRKVFEKQTGFPPLEYVNRYRIHRAMNLLRVTQESVLNISIRCGFSSIATFERNFQRYTRQTPLQWRASHVDET